MAQDLKHCPDGPGRGLVREVVGNRGFVWCVVLLAVFVAGFEVVSIRHGLRFVKEPLPLKAPLSALTAAKLSPYKLLRPGILEPTMIDQLGTDEYVQWLLADPVPDRNGSARARYIRLFVTYYTGKPDPVPHIPETCLVGSGHELLHKETDRVTISGPDGDFDVPMQVLQFERHGLLGPSRQLIIYTFHANGAFHPDRRAVIRTIYDAQSRYAYFSKLELALDIGEGYASAEEATEAAKRFLKVVVPVLRADHWPDWTAATSGEQPVDGGAGSQGHAVSRQTVEEPSPGHA